MVSESTVSNTELSELFWPSPSSGRELSEFLSAFYLCDKANSPSFSQNSPSLPPNSVRLSEFSSPKQYSRNSIPPVSSHWWWLSFGLLRAGCKFGWVCSRSLRKWPEPAMRETSQTEPKLRKRRGVQKSMGNNPNLLFLAFLDFLAFFLSKVFLAFWGVFPFFPKDFRGSATIKNPCFFGGFPCRFPKKARKRRSGKVAWETGMLIYLPVTSRPLIYLQKEAVLSSCNFAHTHLTARIPNFHLPWTWTSRPTKRRILSQRTFWRGSGVAPNFTP